MIQRQNESSREQGDQGFRCLPVEDLLLDAQNPRLARGTEQECPSQFELIKVLWTQMAVDELVLSIAANGYFPEERLFVIPAVPAEEGGKYIVLEGNRRLAAVRILLDDDLRQKLRATNMPKIDGQQFCNFIKKNNMFTGIKVVFCSGMDVDELKALTSECGADGFVHKDEYLGKWVSAQCD